MGQGQHARDHDGTNNLKQKARHSLIKDDRDGIQLPRTGVIGCHWTSSVRGGTGAPGTEPRNMGQHSRDRGGPRTRARQHCRGCGGQSHIHVCDPSSKPWASRCSWPAALWAVGPPAGPRGPLKREQGWQPMVPVTPGGHFWHHPPAATASYRKHPMGGGGHPAARAGADRQRGHTCGKDGTQGIMMALIT